ncbi:hypothetical protein DY000_02024494 [Brassica cretica]|uniref:Uncharacterized protein n=1 Tax=Brassica cretica TaxID=69181 RepID=A0ABQ7E1M5_BRACR|nr:hypothetical protein DY000_02024494 [Brassica cretica]
MKPVWSRARRQWGAKEGLQSRDAELFHGSWMLKLLGLSTLMGTQHILERLSTAGNMNRSTTQTRPHRGQVIKRPFAAGR